MDIGSFDLIKELGAEDFSEENKKELISNYSEALETRISTRLMTELSDKQQEEISKLIEDGKKEEADKYLAENIKDLEYIIRDEVKKFKQDVLQRNQDMQEVIKKYKKD